MPWVWPFCSMVTFERGSARDTILGDAF
ncbi:hypothetical protein RB2654_14355 [Rhodobacterales bacterium HTCC2654]|uniref:Uncharacterized protein n=1 Tax=Maritimibacter alkaliphilus HTCC2654 TaxID=314271 RepID=A3VGS0_9RHOB|nr:hypothetical protein RB2654_14355 [Rhodobacterales bacterium HTCC2654] [Maritimibacter alkaliphilus HTCC2654]